jgi:outer membrane protein OmpA-like peptidoglycan-associated protein
MNNIISMKIIFYSILTFYTGINTCLGQGGEILKDSIKVHIKNCGDFINSPFSDYSSSISADRSVLLFTSRRPHTPKGIKKKREGTEIILLSTFNDSLSSWKMAESIKSPINVENRNSSIISVSNDASVLLLYRDEGSDGNIYQSVLHGADWSEVEKLPNPINSIYHESSASVSPDGKTIYFVSNRPGGKGGRDVWYCTKDSNGEWGKDINIGDSINSTMDEESVFIHPDGKTLYFSSKKEGGFGEYDIYKSVYKNGEWSLAKNLGSEVNSSSNDVFYVLSSDGKYGYLSSDRTGTMGGYDIFEVNYEIIKSSNSSVQSDGPKLTILKGIVKDDVSGKPLEAAIDIYDNKTSELVASFISNSSSGKYLVSLPSGRDYGIAVKKDNYLFHSENFDIPLTSSFQEITKDVNLKNMEVGSKIVLKNIFFDYGKATLREESDNELKRLTKLLTDFPKLKIEISGHTDSKGAADYNQILSYNRAKAVVDYLVKVGIAQDRLVTKGYGKDQPIASNETEGGRQLNRRTEFKILSK